MLNFDKKIIYVGDPMCSWCWGFSNEFKKLLKFTADEFDGEILMGGLRPGTAEPMDQDMKDFIRHHWDEVSKRYAENK